VTVQFEVPGVPLQHYRDRIMTTTISLLRSSGS
jgi:hypothetical protein